MWLEKRGMIASIKKNHCIIITSEGTYERIPVPAVGARVGSELTYRRLVLVPAIKPLLLKPLFLKPLFLAASLLILFTGCALFRQSSLPQAIAYVSVDINPSLEMSVDNNMNVINVTCFNNDAAKLVEQERIKDKNLYVALDMVIDGAIAQNYIKPHQDNLIVSTLTTETASSHIKQQDIQQDLEKSITSAGLTADVKIYSVTEGYRKLAESKGLSPAKFLVYEQLIKSGDKVSIEQVKQTSINNLVHTYKIALLPSGSQIVISKHQPNGEPAPNHPVFSPPNASSHKRIFGVNYGNHRPGKLPIVNLKKVRPMHEISSVARTRTLAHRSKIKQFMYNSQRKKIRPVMHPGRQHLKSFSGQVFNITSWNVE